RPQLSRMRVAFGPSCSPAPTSPNSGARSSSRTDSPCWRSEKAVASPPIPPPTTITSWLSDPDVRLFIGCSPSARGGSSAKRLRKYLEIRLRRIGFRHEEQAALRDRFGGQRAAAPANAARSRGTSGQRSGRRARHSPLHRPPPAFHAGVSGFRDPRSEEHTSELQSRENLVCRLLLEKK